ncbi:MAG: hypothetical protein HZB82_08885 [Deltaproteobacteria bacterium]|nr:hypothetical protein [Deltaproteobacteria bacterium]
MPHGTQSVIAAGIVAAAILFGASAGSNAAALNGDGAAYANPHDYAKKELCSLCHKDEPPRLHFDQITTCVKCHEANLRDHPIARHPIGKAPAISMPGKLPLGKNGQIVCHTCHDPHNRSGSVRMLRVSLQELCASCHVGY